MALLPTNEGVGVAWLRSLPGNIGAATTLPKEVASWAAAGFVVVSVVGGTARDTNLRSPVLSLDCWAVAPDSDRPPWGKANGLAEYVRDAVFQEDMFPVPVVQSPGDYLPALVQSASLVSPDPRRVPDPDMSRAHYVLELSLHWTVMA
jgi:hypothetical protein